MRLPVELGRRQALTRFMGAAALWLTPMGAPAADQIPTFSLKGLKDAVTGADAPRPEAQLGVIGRGKDGTKSGLLNFCDKKGCVSTFASSASSCSGVSEAPLALALAALALASCIAFALALATSALYGAFL